MTDKQVTSVFETSDYDKFKFMLGNRNINLSSVKKIEESISQNGFKMCPILVNEKFEIVDGQHRFNALKDLGLPIYYIIENGLNIEDCKNLNINTKNWSLDDYVRGYADLGYAEYVKLIKMTKELKISFSCGVCLLAGVDYSGGVQITNMAKSGNLKIFYSLNKAKEILNYHKLMRNQFAAHKWYANVDPRISLNVLKFFFHINLFNSKFNLDRFIELLETKSNNLIQGFTPIDLLDSFAEFYNKGLKQKFDFVHLYKEYKKLVPTGKFLENIE